MLIRRIFKQPVLRKLQPLSVAYRKMSIVVTPVRALEDNFMYILTDKTTNKAALVDPVEPKKILEAVRASGVEPTAVLTTHHHWDHSGGNEELVKLAPHLSGAVYGGDDRIPALTHKSKHGDTIALGNLKIECLFTPCHTSGHLCYYVCDQQGGKVVFTGDTLFIAGCGKFFEGTAEQMHHALNGVLGKLPDETHVYVGHEYTVTNLKFAAKMEPNNRDVQEKLAWAQEQVKCGKPTVPSSIAQEKSFNPFMRVSLDALQGLAKSQNPVEVMAFLREQKNLFRA